MSASQNSSSKAKVVIATTVALSFISFWRAAAIVLSDLASSMFYAGGIAEQAIGKSAPWFVLGVMLFSFAVRAVYLESSSMFVRGGVYRVVLDSMGPFLARVSVSALIFDYLLTGPISSVSAGHYIAGLINESAEMFGYHFSIPVRSFAMGFAVVITLFFWWSNIQGIHESSSKALRIMQITTVMVLMLLIWSPLTLLIRREAIIPPLPSPENLSFGPHALGWLEGTIFPQIASIAIIIAFGHAFLSMSGFETLAQVYREIAYPKLANLKITGAIVCFYAFLSTGLITFFAGMIVPETLRVKYADNLIAGLVMNLSGPESLKLIFHAFVVIVGALILSGAVNTAIIGANSVLNRVAEDGVLLPWFRKPHQTFGTTYRIINSFVFLQLIAILVSGGDVYLLGEAYAFGVVWSFFLKSLGVLVLRYQRHDQEYKTPLNFRLRGIEIPLGLMLICFTLFLVALANLFSKVDATIYGFSFTIILFVLFSISNRINTARHGKEKKGLEEFNLDHKEEITPDALSIQSAGVLVAVRDYTSLHPLEWVFSRNSLKNKEIVVATIRPVSAGEGEYVLSEQQFFSDYEKELFSHVVQVAEKAGRSVDLLVLPSSNPIEAIVLTAARLKVNMLVTGVSPRMQAEEFAHLVGHAWEGLPEPRHPFSLMVIGKGKAPLSVHLGPHPPRLWPEDIYRVHDLWLELSDIEGIGSKMHHRDVIGLALSRLSRDVHSERKTEVIEELKASLEERK